MRHSRRYDFQGHLRSGSRSGDDLSPLSGLFLCLVCLPVCLYSERKTSRAIS